MRTKSLEKAPESSRFVKQDDTINVLSEIQSSLDAISEDHDSAGLTVNPRLKDTPYEGAVFYSVATEGDARPKDRASTLAHSLADGLRFNRRLDFYKDHIENRRIILSRTALGESLNDQAQRKNSESTFMTSRMNPHQMVWSRGLIVDDELTAAVQLAYTINATPDWNYTGNDEANKIWQKHEPGLVKAARFLALLSLKTNSLSKSLEIAPPVTPDSYVISWDVVNSTRDSLSVRYPIHESYLEAWKAKRAEITETFNVSVLDRGDGEHIIIPITTNLFDESMVRTHGQRAIQPLINQLLHAHEKIARDFHPDIFRKITIGVGLGNIEADQDGRPTGQAITEVESLRSAAEQPIFYTPSAQKTLLGDK